MFLPEGDVGGGGVRAFSTGGVGGNIVGGATGLGVTVGARGVGVTAPGSLGVGGIGGVTPG